MEGTRSKSLKLEIEQKKLPNLDQQTEKCVFFFLSRAKKVLQKIKAENVPDFLRDNFTNSII